MQRRLALAVLLLLVAGAAGAQVVIRERPGMPPRDAREPQQATGTGSISGRVTAADTGTPLRRVRVRAVSSEARGPRTTLSDADGRYSLDNLPAGRYSLYLTKPGFAQMQYGQKRPQQPGTPIELAEGQKVEDANVVMPRGGVIAGYVFDEFGDPVVDARVMALQYRWMSGRRRLIPAARPGTSNDRGEYRIWGLPPGEYYVSATGGDQMRFTEPGAQSTGDDTGYATTYYPGTPAVDEAQRVSVAAGEEATSIAFTLLMIRTVKVSGVAMTSDNRPMAGGNIMLFARGGLEGGFMGPSGAMIDGKGNFTIGNVAPGDYTITARGPRTPGVGGPDAPQEIATLSLVVGAEDITNLVVAASKGVRVTGRVIFEPGSPPDGLEQVRVMLIPPDEGKMFGGAGSGQVDAQGKFEIRGISGKRYIMIAGLPSSLAVKAVRIGGTDYLDSDYEFGKEDVTGMEIVVTSRVTTLAGAVRDASRQPVSDYAVVAFSTDEEHWRPRSRRLSTAPADQNGIFRIRALPPGSYYVVALDAVPDEWGNPDLLGRLKPLGTQVTLGEAEAKTLELTLSALPEG